MHIEWKLPEDNPQTLSVIFFQRSNRLQRRRLTGRALEITKFLQCYLCLGPSSTRVLRVDSGLAIHGFTAFCWRLPLRAIKNHPGTCRKHRDGQNDYERKITL